MTAKAQQHWPRDFQNVGNTYFELSGKAYDRPGLDGIGFPVLVDGPTGAIFLESNDFTDLGGAGGAEVRFGSDSYRGQKWEVRTWLVNWEEEFFFDNINQTSPLFTALDPDEIDIQFDSRIYSIEFMFRRPVTSGFTFLIGPRFVSFNEDLDFQTATEVPTPLGAVDIFSENELSVRNSMLGGQVGALINHQVSRDIYVQGFIRAGGYANFIEMRTFADTNQTDPQGGLFRRDQSAFIGEVGGKIFCDVIPGTMSGFVGYEATWLDDVAVAPAQAVNGLLPTEIIAGDTPFFHAISFGMQFRRK